MPDETRIEAVLVVSFHPNESEVSSVSSGALFDGNFVVTTGSIFSPHLQGPGQKHLLPSFCAEIKRDEYFSKIKFKVFREIKDNGDPARSKPLHLKNAKLIGFWKCPLVTVSLKKVFQDWTIKYDCGKDISLTQASHDIEKELVSVLVLFKCEGRSEPEQSFEGNVTACEISSIINLAQNLAEPVRGEEIEVISTPFGNEHLLNSLSRGIVCSVVGVEKCLILIDARTVPGCEGGPIFVAKKSRDLTKKENKLIGLVSCPLTWWRGERVGLTVGISLLPVLKKLLQTQTRTFELFPELSTSNSGEYPRLLEVVDDVIVLVVCENTWGSGVVLDSRTVITCSHVIKGSENVCVYYKKNHYSASVVYKTHDDVAFDLAIIRIRNDTFKNSIKFCEKPPQIGERNLSDNESVLTQLLSTGENESELKKSVCLVLGDEVVAVGFPFFSEKEEADIKPSIVRGCIATVHPYMIQTTCCIQSGFSGGALLRNGKLLGIITSNVRNSDVIFPRINFAIPTSVLQQSVFEFLKSNNIQYLEKLQSSNPDVQSLWSLKSSKL